MVVLGTADILIKLSNSLIVTRLIPWSEEVKSCRVGKMMSAQDLTLCLETANSSAALFCYLVSKQ